MIQARRKFLNGVRLSDWFYEQLHLIDPKCDAVLDPYHKDERVTQSSLILPATCKVEGGIHVCSERKPGYTVHEITVSRKVGESNSALEHRTINKLKECDVWKRFGYDANKYADYLDEHDDKLKETLEKEAHDKRVGEMLDNDGDALIRIQKNLSRHVGIGAKPQ